MNVKIKTIIIIIVVFFKFYCIYKFKKENKKYLGNRALIGLFS